MQKKAQGPPFIEDLIRTLLNCRHKKDLHHARRLLSFLQTQELDCHPALGNHIVPMLVDCGCLPDAHRIFDRLPHRNEHSWTKLISGYVGSSKPHHAFELFHRMQYEDCVQPNVYTYLVMINACSRLKDTDRGRELHTGITIRGFERYVFLDSPVVGNTLVDMYGKCGSLDEAQYVFDMLPDRNVVSWNALMSGYGDHGLDQEGRKCLRQMHIQGISPNLVTYICSLKACGTGKTLEMGRETHIEIVKRGLESDPYIGNTVLDMYIKCSSFAEANIVFDRLPTQDAVSWAALISGYAEHGLDGEVLECFKHMQLQGVNSSSTTYVLCLKACSAVGALAVGREIHAKIREMGLETDSFVRSVLIDMYGKCGSISEGQELFDRLPIQDCVSWTAMIKAYGENHKVDMAIQCFEDMQQQGIKPDAITFTCLLVACSHASLVAKAQGYFKLMTEVHSIEPTLDHHSCMIDLFARSGHISEAEKYVSAMQCPPSKVILMPLLSACKIYGKVELGQRCFQLLVEVNQDDAASYLLMADIYASVGRWEDANSVEEKRKFAGAKKTFANALIEVNGAIHEFGVGLIKDVAEAVEVLSLCIRIEGYIPNLILYMRHTCEEERELSHQSVH